MFFINDRYVEFSTSTKSTSRKKINPKKLKDKLNKPVSYNPSKSIEENRKWNNINRTSSEARGWVNTLLNAKRLLS